MSRPTTRPQVDPRDAAAFLADLLSRRQGYVPEWRPGATGPDVALAEIAARYLAALATRLNQVPDKHQLAMLDALGVGLVPARAARAPVVFTLAADAADTRVPAGTRLTAKPAPPPPTRADLSGTGLPADPPATTPPAPLVFETERGTGLAAGRLVEVRSHWPGRDQSIDHMPALTAGQVIRPWLKADLQDDPHHLYLAHRTLLALTGSSDVAVTFELSQRSSEPLDTIWEYWDGKVWRPFKNSYAGCDRDEAEAEDGTSRFQRDGTVRLQAACAETKPTTVGGFENYWVRGRLTEPLPPDRRQLLPEVEQIQLSVVTTCTAEQADVAKPPAKKDAAGKGDGAKPPVPTISGGIVPDAAIAGGTKVNLSEPFYPFGMDPRPGSVFYFSSAEIFAKPKAQVEVWFVRAKTPQDEAAVGGTELQHEVAWEYWNGREWARIPGFVASTSAAPADLAPDAEAIALTPVVLTVPDDIEATEVADVEARWMRVRLISGGYGITRTITWEVGHPPENTISFNVPRPPALAEFKLGYTWTYGPFPPERVLTYNDFQYTDRTDEAVWPGKVFRPFTPPQDVTPALYLGFDKPLPVDDLGIFFDVVEDPADPQGPALEWEYWDGGRWRHLRVDDETQRLRLPGMVQLIGAPDSAPLARFGTDRSWLRARLGEDGPPGAPSIRAIHHNATWAVQQQTILDDPIGAGTGLPDQVLAIRQIPVLEGERIEIRELAGARAPVEWRIVALELLGDHAAVREIDALLGREAAGDVEYGPLRLRRDRNKKVTEVWVRWSGVEHLLRSGPNDRHYALDRAVGRLQFGDGTSGKVPPAGAAILARRYQSGGGSSGNVPAGAITQLQASIGGVSGVRNPLPAGGGADAETLDALRVRGPATLRHRGRGLSATDLANLAREASPAVAVATALPGRAGDGRRRPGHVTIVIIPASEEPRPWPSFGLRESVRRYVVARAEATAAGLGRIDVTGPEYTPVDVDATVVPRDPTEAGAVEARSRAALARLLHPLHGGPDGGGWPPGRDVHLSDVAAVLERVEGVDYVADLAISSGGRIGGEVVPVADFRTVVAGVLRLKLSRG